MSSSDYIYARESKFANKGEDIKESARHKVNAWRGLSAAEKDGSAGSLVTIKNLLKFNPPIYPRITEENYKSILMSHICLSLFPPKPKYRDGESAKQTRSDYVSAYETVKSEVEKTAQLSSESHLQIAKSISMITDEIIDKLRISDSYNSVANSLCYYHNRTLDTRTQYDGNFVGNALKKYALAIENTFELSPKARIEKIKVFISGDNSFQSCFSIKPEKRGKRQKRFTIADIYLSDGERFGPKLGLKTTVERENFLIEKVGMRGLQWGNSVTDKERVAHLKYLPESFNDLAYALGIQLNALSMNGRLGLAVGARGHGLAMAHYEPDLSVINLTRKNGVGSLAHEWAHFIDNCISDTLPSKRYSYFTVFVRAERQEITTVEHPLVKPYLGLLKEIEKYKIRMANPKTAIERKYYYLMVNKAEYWLNPKELFARCFERYVYLKLKNEGRTNTYLSCGDAHYLWPTDCETKRMVKHFDKFFKTFFIGLSKWVS